MSRRLKKRKAAHAAYSKLGYLDSNQEQLVRAGLPVSEAPHPQARMISRKLVNAVYLLLPADTGCFWHLLRVFGTQSGTANSA